MKKMMTTLLLSLVFISLGNNFTAYGYGDEYVENAPSSVSEQPSTMDEDTIDSNSTTESTYPAVTPEETQSSEVYTFDE